MVLEVYAFIARSSGAAAAGPQSSAGAGSGVPKGVGRGDRQEIQIRGYWEATPGQQKVFDLMLEAPGRRFTSIELDKALRGSDTSEGDDYTLNGTLGSFGAKARALYEGIKPYEEQIDPKDGRKRYWITPETAEAILAARRPDDT